MKNINLNDIKSILKSMAREEDNGYGQIEVSCTEHYGFDEELNEITCSARTLTIKQNW